MNETAYIRSINRFIPSHIYRAKLNNPFTAGIPDSWYSGNAGDLWIEWKLIRKTPKRKLTVALSPLQQEWLTQRHNEGRNVAVLVGTPDGVLVLTDLAWTAPITKFRYITKRDAATWITNQVSTLDSSEHKSTPPTNASSDTSTCSASQKGSSPATNPPLTPTTTSLSTTRTSPSPASSTPPTTSTNDSPSPR